METRIDRLNLPLKPNEGVIEREEEEGGSEVKRERGLWRITSCLLHRGRRWSRGKRSGTVDQSDCSGLLA